MQPGVLDFVGRLEGATTAAEAWSLALDHFAGLGGEWLYHGYMAPLWKQERRAFLQNSNLPRWWDKHRQEQGYRHHDPAVLHCLRSAAPLPFGPGMALYSKPARRMYAESAEWGARCGVAFPLRNLPGSPLGGFAVITRMDAEAFKGWWQVARRDVSLAALATDARLLQLCQVAAEPVPALSARERECLVWLSAGLRTDRIAHRLNISTTAVELYVANARRKLGARTRDQALLKAVMLGQVVP